MMPLVPMAESSVPVSVALWLGVALLLFNAFFVGAEFALISVRRTKIEPLARQGSRQARTTLRAMEEVTLMMAGAQLGITVCTVLLGAVAEPGLATLLEPLIDRAGLPEEVGGVVAFIIAISIVVILHVVLGEMVPKNIALASPERSALVLGPPLKLVVTIIRPLIWALNGLANISMRVFGIAPRDEVASTFTSDEVRGIVQESRDEGMIADDSYALLSGALNFSDRTVESVILRLDELTYVTPRATVGDLEELTARTGYSRFPVLREGSAGDGPQALGYVHIKDTLGEDRNTVIGNKWTRPMPFVRTDTLLGDAMQTMQSRRAHMAGVLDDDDQMAGVIALEDVIEELIGEIQAPVRRDAT